MYTRKTLPKTQYELSKGVEDKLYGRENDVRRDDDTLSELSIGLFDMDYAIKYYFENVIRPEVVEFGNTVKVPIMYGSPEKWKNVQADGYFRDKNGKILSPLIAYKRTAIAKNRTLSSKVDANYPQIYHNSEVKYTQINKYDQFSRLTNSKPIKTYINTVVPDYVDLTYDVVVWTDYIESMNKIVESMIYTEGSYWGDPERFKFRSKIENFTNTTDLLQDADRIVRTSFQITIFGQIVPDVLAAKLSKKQSEKTFDDRHLIVDTIVDADPTIFDELQVGRASTATTTPTIMSTTTITGGKNIDPRLVEYLYSNKTVQASTVTVPNKAYFNAFIITAPAGYPATSKANFSFFINGQLMEPLAITDFTETGGVCELTVNTAELGFTLVATDEIVAIGKFA